jgi:hypothetical protein
LIANLSAFVLVVGMLTSIAKAESISGTACNKKALSQQRLYKYF